MVVGYVKHGKELTGFPTLALLKLVFAFFTFVFIFYLRFYSNFLIMYSFFAAWSVNTVVKQELLDWNVLRQ